VICDSRFLIYFNDVIRQHYYNSSFIADRVRRATWRQSHSRWVNRPHTFDNSGLAKWELVNQIGRLHALARWATRQEFLFGKKAGKCESVWRGGYNTHGQKEFVKPRKSGWNYGKFSNVRIDLYSNSLML
jgi:hypothetical protein